MRSDITVVYNEPFPEGYEGDLEPEAVEGVMQCVNSVHIALLDCGYTVGLLPVVPPLNSVKKQLEKINTDLVFNLFEGFYDFPESEASVAGYFTEMGYIMTGCPSEALIAALDKAKSKDLMKNSGISVPQYQILTGENINQFRLNFPCIVKPRNQDASHGITVDSVVDNMDELKRQVEAVTRLFAGEALVEEFLSGREFNVTVLGNSELTVLPPSEIVYNLPPDKPPILTYEAKWLGDTEYFKGTSVDCPAKIDEGLRNRIEEYAINAFRLFSCSGYARLDMREDAHKVLKVMEVNPNPDISPDTGAARQAHAAGMSYSQLIDKIVGYALEKVPA